MKRKTLLTALTILLAVSFPGSVYAIPQLIDYQGKLLENGVPPQDPVNITFRIYDSETALVDDALWNETHSVSVDVETGLFNVLLGSIQTLDTSVITGAVRWLGIEVEGDGEMDPRKQIVSVAHAYQAENATTAGTATNATNATNANYASTAGSATTATNATNADYATNAGTATNATNANYATTADTATNATNATNANYSANADKLDNYDSTYFINTSGGQTINNNLTVDADLFVNDDLNVDDTLTISTYSDISGSLELYGDLEIHENSASYALEVRQDGPYYGALIRNDSVAGNYPALKVINYGDGPAAEFDGAVIVNGTQVHPDYVFDTDYKLESIEEHSKFMWQEKHLPAVPAAKTDGNGKYTWEVGKQSMGILEELEKAHIYIEKLNNKIKELEQKMEKMELVNAELGESSEK